MKPKQVPFFALLPAIMAVVANCSDSVTVIGDVDPVEGDQSHEPMVPEIIDDVEWVDPNAPVHGQDEFLDAGPGVYDADGPPPLIANPEPEDLGPPAPPWLEALVLIPTDESMADVIRRERIVELFREAYGLRIDIAPVGTSSRHGIPIGWKDVVSPDGRARMRVGCYWTKCYGNNLGSIWINSRFKDITKPYLRRTIMHEIGHIITGLGVKSKLDTAGSGHLPNGPINYGNLMDPTCNPWLTPLDHEYICTTGPCEYLPEGKFFIGNQTYALDFPGLDAGAPEDAGFGAEYQDELSRH